MSVISLPRYTRPAKPITSFSSSLILRGTPRTLQSLNSIALIVHKQIDPVYNFSAGLRSEQTLGSQEAGIVAWVNDEYHNTVSVVLCKTKKAPFE
jgi:hypothetical protein